MANAKHKSSQLDDNSGNDNTQTQPNQTIPNSENENTNTQTEALNGYNNETNDTGTATGESIGNTSNIYPSEAQSTAPTGTEPTNNGNNEVIPVKKTRKRRRKGEPEPDHTATVVEKARKMKRVPQACDRCHVRRFRCDNGPHGCYRCLSSGHMCTVTDRNTGRSRVRGGGDGIVVNFDQVQVENEDLKIRNQEQSQRIDELQNEIGHLRGQLQYYQSLPPSIGATNSLNHAPVSMSNGVHFNPGAMHPSYPALNHTQPFAPHYNSMNSNAFSGNMSIHYNPNMPNMPHGNTMPNTGPYSQWPQPNIHQGFPLPSHPQLMTQAYNPYYPQVPVSPMSAQRGILPSQNNIGRQGIIHPGTPITGFHPESWQARAPPHQLLMHRPLGNRTMNVSNRHILSQTPQNQNHYFPQAGPDMGTGRGRDTDPQNQNSQNLAGLGIHYSSTQAHQGYQTQDTNAQPQGMRPTGVSREGHYQGPGVSAYNEGMQYQNHQNQNQHAGAQIQDNHHQNLPAQQQQHQQQQEQQQGQQQQPPDLPPNPPLESTTIAQEQEIQQEQLSQSLDLLEPTLESSSNNQNPELIVNPDLILPDTGPSELPTLDDVGGLDFQYVDGFYDVDTTLYNALTQFSNDNAVGQEVPALTTNTTEGPIDAPNPSNELNMVSDGNQTQGQTQVEEQGQVQGQGNQDTDLPSFGLFSEEDWFGNSGDGLF